MHFGLDDGVSHPYILMYKNPYKELWSSRNREMDTDPVESWLANRGHILPTPA